MRKTHEKAVGLILSVGLLGCADSTDRPQGGDPLGGPSSAAPDWCASMCNNYRRCNGDVAYGCVTSCLAADAGFFARRSTPALEFEIDCMATAVCPVDFAELISGCFTDSLAALEPTEEAGQLCDDLASDFFACSWFPSRDSCARFHANFSAAALASERGCSGSSCEELDACIQTRLYGYGE